MPVLMCLCLYLYVKENRCFRFKGFCLVSECWFVREKIKILEEIETQKENEYTTFCKQS